MQHTYIDGTKIEANANRYTWVWKKSCMKNRQKVFDKISILIDAMNQMPAPAMERSVNPSVGSNFDMSV